MSKGRRICNVNVRCDGSFLIVPEDFAMIRVRSDGPRRLAYNTKQVSVQEEAAGNLICGSKCGGS